MEAYLCFGLRIKVTLDLYEEDLPLDCLWRVVALYFEKDSNFDLCDLKILISRNRNLSCMMYFILGYRKLYRISHLTRRRIQ